MNAKQQMRDADLYRIDNPTTRSRRDLLRQESSTSIRNIQSLPPQLPNHSPRSQFARRDMQSLSSRSLRKLQVQPNFLQHETTNKKTNEKGTSDLQIDEDRRRPNIETEEPPAEDIPIVASSETHNSIQDSLQEAVDIRASVNEKAVAAVDRNFQKLSITFAANSITSTSSTEQLPDSQGQKGDIEMKKKGGENSYNQQGHQQQEQEQVGPATKRPLPRRWSRDHARGSHAAEHPPHRTRPDPSAGHRRVFSLPLSRGGLY